MSAAAKKKMMTLSPGMRRTLEIYHPCAHGVHVCGADHEAQEFYTVVNYPGASFEAFCRAKAAIEEPTDPKDYVVDFMEDGDCMEDFWISRQMLNRLALELGGTP